MVLKTKKGEIAFVYISAVSLYQKEGEITVETFKGPNCEQTPRFEFNIMTRLSIAAFDAGSLPTPFRNANQHKSATIWRCYKRLTLDKIVYFIQKKTESLSIHLKRKGPFYLQKNDEGKNSSEGHIV